jgi:FkbM family methyltransferase
MSFPVKSLQNPFGARLPGLWERAALAITSALPDTWLGLRMAMLLRKPVMARLAREGRDAALDVRRWGIKLRLHPLDNGCEKNLLFTPQMYEPAEFAALERDIAAARRDVRPYVFIDIGASVGLFSLFAATRTGTMARSLAIEPEPGSLARLTFNVASNPGLPIRPIAAALGAEEGEIVIALNRRDRGGSRAYRVTDPKTDTRGVRVPCRPLLTLLRVQGITSVDALKIDVEGMEDEVLMPFFAEAPRTLWPRMILIANSDHEWRSDLFGVLAHHDYIVTAVTRQNVILRLPAQPEMDIFSDTEMPSRAIAQR